MFQHQHHQIFWSHTSLMQRMCIGHSLLMKLPGSHHGLPPILINHDQGGFSWFSLRPLDDRLNQCLIGHANLNLNRYERLNSIRAAGGLCFRCQDIQAPAQQNIMFLVCAGK